MYVCVYVYIYVYIYVCVVCNQFINKNIVLFVRLFFKQGFFLDFIFLCFLQIKVENGIAVVEMIPQKQSKDAILSLNGESVDNGETQLFVESIDDCSTLSSDGVLSVFLTDTLLNFFEQRLGRWCNRLFVIVVESVQFALCSCCFTCFKCAFLLDIIESRYQR